jgi:cytochrome P450
MTSHNALAAATRSSIEWHCQDKKVNPFKHWNPMRPLTEWRNGKTMDRYISTELDKRYEDWRTNEPSTRAKSVMDIAIAAYMGERKAAAKLDFDVKKCATVQIQLFLSAGHDSTAAMIVYSLCMLSKHPEIPSRGSRRT